MENTQLGTPSLNKRWYPEYWQASSQRCLIVTHAPNFTLVCQLSIHSAKTVRFRQSFCLYRLCEFPMNFRPQKWAGTPTKPSNSTRCFSPSRNTILKGPTRYLTSNPLFLPQKLTIRLCFSSWTPSSASWGERPISSPVAAGATGKRSVENF